MQEASLPVFLDLELIGEMGYDEGLDMPQTWQDAYFNLKWSLNKCSTHFKISKSNLSRWIHAINEGVTIKPRGGRAPILKGEDIITIKDRIQHNDMGSSSHDFVGIVNVIDTYNETENSKNKKMKRSSQHKYVKIIAPEVMKTSQIKNPRRSQALRDMFAPVSHSSILEAILQPTPDNPIGRINPMFRFNLDAVSCLVGKTGPTRVYLAEGSKKALHKVNRSPSTQQNLRKCRGVKILPS
jgi:hypothetical protein